MCGRYAEWSRSWREEGHALASTVWRHIRLHGCREEGRVVLSNDNGRQADEVAVLGWSEVLLQLVLGQSLYWRFRYLPLKLNADLV